MLVFDTCGLYIESRTTLQARLDAVNAIIAALESALIRAAAGEDISEYQLNDGQTIIKQVSRGVKGITNSMNGMIALKEYYINKLNGRVFRPMPSRNFRPNRGGQF